MELLSVSFVNYIWTDSYDALKTVRGVLRTEPEGVELEFSVSENSYGRRPSETSAIRTVTIPWREIQSLVYRPRWFVLGALVLRTRSMRTLEGVPGAQGIEFTIGISRGERLPAREVAANVELTLAEQRIEALGAPSVPRSLPPS